MKRKLLETLLKNHHSEDLRERIAEILPSSLGPSAESACTVLANAIEVSQHIRRLDAASLYNIVCSSTSANLAAFLQGTPAESIPRSSLILAQSLLNQTLTSKAGRPKTSAQPRSEQLAQAQARRREKKLSEGRKRINVFITPAAASYLDSIKIAHACAGQAEALELVLEKAIKGEVLTLPNGEHNDD